MRRVSNPPNPFQHAELEWDGPAPPAELEVYEERARSALTKNKSPDVGFVYGVNPYRGCFHACAYCYARTTHQYLDFGAGTDFDRRIVVKTNAAAQLARELKRKSWRGDLIVFSGNTDCYQPLEAHYRLTRACLEVCRDRANPVGIITKSKLVTRDIDVLKPLAEQGRCNVTISVPFADANMARAIEPFVCSPEKRLRAIAQLSEAGISTTISLAPIIPGLNDSQIPEILERAKDAGAQQAFMTLIRLPGEVAQVFEQRLRAAFPDRANKVMNAIRSMRRGSIYRSEFGARMRGEGPRWNAIAALFDTHRKRVGFPPPQNGPVLPQPPASQPATKQSTTNQSIQAKRQLELFDDISRQCGQSFT